MFAGAGYNRSSGRGDLVLLKNGAPVHVTTVGATVGMYGISCPTGGGCVALGQPNDAYNTVLVPINRSGVVRPKSLPYLPPFVSIHRLGCSAPNNCVVAGDDLFKTPYT